MNDASFEVHDSRLVTLVENLGRRLVSCRVAGDCTAQRAAQAESRGHVTAGCCAVQTSASKPAAVRYLLGKVAHRLSIRDVLTITFSHYRFRSFGGVMLRPSCINLIALAMLVARCFLMPGLAMATATAPPLGTAQSFAVLAGSAVTNTGNTIITGDMGLSPGTALTGFPPGVVVPPGTTHVNDAVALTAQNDATTAYNNMAGQACDFGPFGPTDLAGQTLVPGVYCYSSSLQNSGTVTLDGTPTDVWVFKVASTLTAGPGSSVSGTGSKCNIYWQIGSSATLDTTSVLEGTIISLQSITLNNGATVKGRTLARNGASTMINDSVDASGCPGVTPPGGVGLFKSFTPSNVGPGGTSPLTITLTNANTTPATLTAPFNDTFPAGLTIANPSNLATTCGVGVPTGTPGGSTVGLPIGTTIPGGSVAVPGFCTLSVDVTASIAGCYTNTIPVGGLQTDGGNNTGTPTTASLCVNANAIAATPALSTWAMIALSLLLLAFAGSIAMAKRKS